MTYYDYNGYRIIYKSSNIELLYLQQQTKYKNHGNHRKSERKYKERSIRY